MSLIVYHTAVWRDCLTFGDTWSISIIVVAPDVIRFLFRSTFGWILTLFLRRVSSPEAPRDLHGIADSICTSNFVRALSMVSLNCKSSGSMYKIPLNCGMLRNAFPVPIWKELKTPRQKAKIGGQVFASFVISTIEIFLSAPICWVLSRWRAGRLLDGGASRCDPKRGQREETAEVSETDFESMVFEKMLTCRSLVKRPSACGVPCWHRAERQNLGRLSGARSIAQRQRFEENCPQWDGCSLRLPGRLVGSSPPNHEVKLSTSLNMAPTATFSACSSRPGRCLWRWREKLRADSTGVVFDSGHVNAEERIIEIRPSYHHLLCADVGPDCRITERRFDGHG